MVARRAATQIDCVRAADFSKLLRRVGHRVRAARELAELTQEAAAARAGIDARRWQRLEAGEVNISLRTLWRVAHALDTSVSTITGDAI